MDQRALHRHENGYLVAELTETPHEMYQALITVGHGVKLPRFLLEHTFRFCPEAHIGHQGYEPKTCNDLKSGSRNAFHVWTRGFVVHFVAPIDCFRRFHLYDRVGNPLLTHNDRLKIPKIPAMLELCIQEGFDLKEIGMLDKAKGSPYIHGCRADHRI